MEVWGSAKGGADQSGTVVSGVFSISRRVLWDLCEVLGSKWDSLQVGFDQGLVNYPVCDIQGQDLKAHLVWNLQCSFDLFKAKCEGAGIRITTSKSKVVVLSSWVGNETLPQKRKFEYLWVGPDWKNQAAKMAEWLASPLRIGWEAQSSIADLQLQL